MTFVRSFVRPARWLDWHLSIPIYDGRDCPECGALIIGPKRRKAHQEWHTARTEWDSHIREAIRRLASELGLNVREPRREDAPDGIYDEDQDDRLTAKARLVHGYDDEDDEDDDE